LWGRLEAINTPTRGKARKGTNTNRPPTVPQVLEGRVSGAPDKDKRVIAKPATNMDRERPASAYASQVAARVPIPPNPRSCSLAPSVTTPLYRRTVSHSLRHPFRERRAAAHFREPRQGDADGGQAESMTGRVVVVGMTARDNCSSSAARACISTRPCDWRSDQRGLQSSGSGWDPQRRA
jgi:hypothetical protein